MPESHPAPIIKATVFVGTDGSHRISLHRFSRVHLSPKAALSIAREIHQHAIDAMRADGEREEWK
ncbi:hypothetical protein ACI2KS_10060 [Pseudomonas sp. NPDC087358]|uniref:hypothetical protein n=1 Tax=Pseudomonas sp. NPDC087358 TaxID=3364439 RepID=UPI00384D87BA